MLGIRVLIGLSRLLHPHITYEIDTAKIIAAFTRISYCLLDLIRLNSIVCHVQTRRCTMMPFSQIHYAINWPWSEFEYWYGNLDTFVFILHMILVRQKSSQHSSEFSVVCMIWYAWNQSSDMFKQQDVRWCGFRWPIPLSIDYDRNASIDRAISTPSCSYCIWNRWYQNDRSIFPNFLLFAWFDTVEINRLPCSKSKMYDDVVFDYRFGYQLTYVWSEYIDRIILTHWYWYFMWSNYINHHHW